MDVKLLCSNSSAVPLCSDAHRVSVLVLGLLLLWRRDLTPLMRSTGCLGPKQGK